MKILAWTLTLPVLALIFSIAWVAWTSRPRGPVDPRQSTADYERFRAALATPLPRQPEKGGDRKRSLAATARKDAA